MFCRTVLVLIILVAASTLQAEETPPQTNVPLREFIKRNSPGDEFTLIGEGTYSPIRLAPSLEPIYFLVFSRVVNDTPTDERAVVVARFASTGFSHLITMRSRGSMTPIGYKGYDLVDQSEKTATFTMRWQFTGNRGPQVSVKCQYDGHSIKEVATNICRFEDGHWVWTKADFSLTRSQKE